MKSIKAILAGSAFIIFTLFLLGLAYIFIAVAYNTLSAEFPFLNDITGLFRYIVGIPVFILIMFAGGYITASIAKMHSNLKTWLHCLAVGSITVGSMMYSALDKAELTTSGIVVSILALTASSAGGLYWQRGKQQK